MKRLVAAFILLAALSFSGAANAQVACVGAACPSQTMTITNTTSPNNVGGVTWTMSEAPSTTSTGTVFSARCLAIYTGSIDLANPGHMIGCWGHAIMNAAGKLADLLVATEGKLEVIAGNVTTGIPVLCVLTDNAAGSTITSLGLCYGQVTNHGTITTMYGYTPHIAFNSGTIGTAYDFYSEDASAVPGSGTNANRFSLANADASKPIKTAGEVQFPFTSPDTGIKRAAVSTLQVTNAAGAQGYLNMAGKKYVSTQFDAASTTTLATVTGLSANVVASRAYHFVATLYVTAAAAGGHKYAIAGTATATAVHYQITAFDNTAKSIKIATDATALGTAGAEAPTSGTSYKTVIEGTILVNAAGTLLVQFAENTASGTSSVLVGSSFVIEDIT